MSWTKKPWAKGRNKQYFVNVSLETRELAKALALEEKMTMKDLIAEAVKSYRDEIDISKQFLDHLKC